MGSAPASKAAAPEILSFGCPLGLSTWADRPVLRAVRFYMSKPQSAKGEVDELKELFASPARPASHEPSALMQGKFATAEERGLAQGRVDKEERLRQREQSAIERLAKAEAEADKSNQWRDARFEANRKDPKLEKSQNLPIREAV